MVCFDAQRNRNTELRRSTGVLVGTDKYGNKYYEKLDSASGQHRWVEYKERNGASYLEWIQLLFKKLDCNQLRGIFLVFYFCTEAEASKYRQE